MKNETRWSYQTEKWEIEVYASSAEEAISTFADYGIHNVDKEKVREVRVSPQDIRPIE